MLKIKTTKRFCSAVSKEVKLTADIVVQQIGCPSSEIEIGVHKWKSCSHKAICGKKCNYFYSGTECDFKACEEKELRRI